MWSFTNCAPFSNHLETPSRCARCSVSPHCASCLSISARTDPNCNRKSPNSWRFPDRDRAVRISSMILAIRVEATLLTIPSKGMLNNSIQRQNWNALFAANSSRCAGSLASFQIGLVPRSKISRISQGFSPSGSRKNPEIAISGSGEEILRRFRLWMGAFETYIILHYISEKKNVHSIGSYSTLKKNIRRKSGNCCQQRFYQGWPGACIISAGTSHS